MPSFGDPPEPLLALLGGAADDDRVAAQEGGQHRGCESDVKAGEPFADPVGVERSAAESAVLLRDEDKLHAKVFTAHRADRFLRADIVVVKVQPAVVRQRLGDEIVQ